MSKPRASVVLALVVAFPLVTGCGSGSNTATSTAAMPTSAGNGGDTAASPTAQGGGAGGSAAFCTAMMNLGNTVGSATSPAEEATALANAATALQQNAPAEISTQAATYATLLSTLATAAQGGTLTSQQIAEKMAANLTGANANDVTQVATWVAKNCNN